MNIATLFSKNNRKDESMETNILLGLALINARRFLQASELLQQTSAYFYQIYRQTRIFEKSYDNFEREGGRGRG